jgi:hypothetical protein
MYWVASSIMGLAEQIVSTAKGFKKGNDLERSLI